MSIKNDILELFESQATLSNVMNIRNQYQDYLKKMYGIKYQSDAKIEAEKAEAVDKDKALKTATAEKEASRYLKQADDILASFEDEKTRYKNQIESINTAAEKQKELAGDDKSKLDKIETTRQSKIDEAEKKIRDSKMYHVEMLRKLNATLSPEAEDVLEAKGKYRISIRDLTLTEQNLIFGDDLDTIKEIYNLNESIEDAKTLSASQGHKNAAAEIAVDVKTKYQKGLATASEANSAEMDAREAERNHLAVKREISTAETKDPVSGEKLTEEFLAQRQLDNVEARIEKENDRHDKIMNNLKKIKNRLTKNKKLAQAVKDQQEADENTTSTQITEADLNKKVSSEKNDGRPETTTTKVEPESPNAIKNLDESVENIEFQEYSKMLFNGASGNALKYFIKDEINNTNMKDIEIAKTMKSDPNVQSCIKKIQFYLRKTRKGLSYEEYIDLKVQKSKFASFFNSAKKAYENKYKK